MAYTLKRSQRARYMRLTVHPGGTVVVTAPERLSTQAIHAFLASKAAWLEKAIRRMRPVVALPGGKREYRARREAARALVLERLGYWNAFYKFRYNRVAIKNTTSLWGSCSRTGNLNFSYKLIYVPQRLADYVIVHELCHLQEHNHGPRFWMLVAATLPDYAARRRELRAYLLR